MEIQKEEKLIVLAEVERKYWSSNRITKSDSNGSSDVITVKDLSQSIKRAVAKNHDLQAHTILLLKPGSLPKTSSGKIQRHACRTEFLNNSLEGLPS